MFNLSEQKTLPKGVVFTCVSCNKSTVDIPRKACCGKHLFKVGYSTTGVPIMQDPDSQYDPYRKKHFSPEKGQQFNNLPGDNSQFSTVGGPNDRQPPSGDYPPSHHLEDRFDPDHPDARPLPHDGGEGDTFSDDTSNVGYFPDDSPLNKKTKAKDKNPYNSMNALVGLYREDPYALLQKRKRK